jgi:hypothetical protein
MGPHANLERTTSRNRNVMAAQRVRPGFRSVSPPAARGKDAKEAMRDSVGEEEA